MVDGKKEGPTAEEIRAREAKIQEEGGVHPDDTREFVESPANAELPSEGGLDSEFSDRAKGGLGANEGS